MIIYILKSGLFLFTFLIAYKLLFNKDKRFEFRRFYLLFTLVFSLLAPLVNISWFNNVDFVDQSHLSMIRSSVDSIGLAEHFPTRKQDPEELNLWSLTNISYLLYLIGTLILAFRYGRNLWSVRLMIKNCERLNHGKMTLALSNTQSDPFCFGKYVFVNKQQYIDNKIDPVVLCHERAHVNGKHTLDVLLIEFLIIFYWFNPLLWIYRFLIKANHEFIADQKVLNSGTRQEHYFQQLIRLVNQSELPLPMSGFNYFLIKNRIAMMNTKNTTRINFSIKVLACAVVLLVTFFTITSFQYSNSGLQLGHDYDFTVVIDPAHGGKDTGASVKGLSEKDLALDIAKLIENKLDPTVKVILTRTSDVNMTLKDRNELAKKGKADLFLSIHVNSAVNEKLSGIEIYHSDPSAASYGNIIANNLTSFDADPRVDIANFAVLQDLDCPAMLLELGFISNEKDFQMLSSDTKLNILAEKLAKGVEEISKL